MGNSTKPVDVARFIPGMTAEMYESYRRVSGQIVLAHRRELVEQLSRTADKQQSTQLESVSINGAKTTEDAQ